MQLSTEIFSVNSMQPETCSHSPELTCVHISTFPHAAISVMLKYTDALAYTCTNTLLYLCINTGRNSLICAHNHTHGNPNHQHVLLCMLMPPIRTLPLSHKDACEDASTFMHLAKKLQNSEGGMNKSGLKGPLKI